MQWRLISLQSLPQMMQNSMQKAAWALPAQDKYSIVVADDYAAAHAI